MYKINVYATIALTIEKKSFCLWMGMIGLVNSKETPVTATLSETSQFSGQRRPPHNDRVRDLYRPGGLYVCELLAVCSLLKLS